MHPEKDSDHYPSCVAPPIYYACRDARCLREPSSLKCRSRSSTSKGRQRRGKVGGLFPKIELSHNIPSLSAHKQIEIWSKIAPSALSVWADEYYEVQGLNQGRNVRFEWESYLFGATDQHIIRSKCDSISTE